MDFKKNKIDISRYHDKGYMGLANLGNTCFMNSCLQVLNHIYELNEVFLVKKIHLKSANTNEKQHDLQFIKEWVELQEVLWSTNGSAVSPNKFVHYVQYLARIKDKDIFTGWAQNDMPEFLLFMIDTMHNGICREVKMKISGNKKTKKDDLAIECYNMLQNVYEKEYSEVMDIFYGIYVSVIKSNTTVQTVYSQKPEMYFVLDLPLPIRKNTDPIITLNDCFELFTTAEVLEGDEAWFNEKTGEKESVTKQIQFWNFPNILVIMLKRFSVHGRNKRQDLVEFPLEGLDLSKYVCGYNSNSYVYDLFGVCNHMGGILGGHYHCYVKNSMNEWIFYNDIHYEKMKDTSQIVSPTAYCLFYRKR